MKAPVHDIIKILIKEKKAHKGVDVSTLKGVSRGTGDPKTLIIGGRRYKIVSR